MSENQNNVEHDEIDLRDLIISIWAGRWLISLVTIASVLIGAVFINYTRNNFEVAVEIEPITIKEFGRYSKYNDTLSFVENNKLAPVQRLEELTVDRHMLNEKFFKELTVERQMLIEKFLNELKLGDGLGLSLLEFFNTSGLDQNSSEGFEEYYLDFRGKITVSKNKFELLGDELIEVEPAGLEFAISGEKNEIRNFIGKWFDAATNDVQQNYISNYNDVISSYSQFLAWEFEDIKQKRADLIENYSLVTAQKVEYLSEQAEIARSLGIRDNALGAKMAENQDLFSLVLDNRQLFYMRGYEAIEKEIKLIQGRDDPTRHIPELIELEARERVLKNDLTLARLDESFNDAPIASDSFEAVAKNYILKIDKVYNPAIILILSALLGGIFGVFILLIKNLIRE